MSQWQADAVLALLTIVTGATYFISKIVLQTVDPFDFLAIRFLSSALILYGVFYQRIHQLRWEIFLPCLRVGVFLSVGIVMMTLGLQQTTALTSGKRKKLAMLEQELQELESIDEILRDHQRIEALKLEIAELSKRIKRVPWLDDFDLKYNLHIKEPNPQSKAVMFCVMDVSGSMDQATKDIAKRFFILLYLFLQRNYERTDVVFIRHHTSASEVDEQEFFYSRETGGTIVSSALKLMNSIISERYPSDQWNIYGAQASDGDNWNDDSSICREILSNNILPKVQYFSYIEITPREHQSLWEDYAIVQENFPNVFAMQQIVEASEIYTVFHELFQKQAA